MEICGNYLNFLQLTDSNKIVSAETIRKNAVSFSLSENDQGPKNLAKPKVSVVLPLATEVLG